MDKVILIMTLCLIGQATLVPLSAENQLQNEGPPVKNSDSSAHIGDKPTTPSTEQAQEGSNQGGTQNQVQQENEPVLHPPQLNTENKFDHQEQKEYQGEKKQDDMTKENQDDLQTKEPVIVDERPQEPVQTEQMAERHEGQDAQLDDNQYLVPEKGKPIDTHEGKEDKPLEAAQGIPVEKGDIEQDANPLLMRPTAEYEERDERQGEEEQDNDRQSDGDQAAGPDDGNTYDTKQDEYDSNEEVKPAQADNQEPDIQGDQKYIGERLMEPDIEGRFVHMRQTEPKNTEPIPPVHHQEKEYQSQEERREYQEDSNIHQENRPYQEDNRQYQEDSNTQDGNRQYQESNTQHQEDNSQYQDDDSQYQENTQHHEDRAKDQYQEDNNQYQVDDSQYQENTQHHEDRAKDQYQEDARQYQEENREYHEDGTQYQEENTQHQDDNRRQDGDAQYPEERTQYQEDNTQYHEQEPEQQVDYTQEYHTESSQGQEQEHFKAEESNQYQEVSEQPVENAEYHEDDLQQYHQQEPEEQYKQPPDLNEPQKQEVEAASTEHIEQKEQVVQQVGKDTPLPANPNVVIFLADGISKSDFVDGESLVPNLMRIADEGVYFSNHMAGGVTDTSSRAALMTGRLAVRYGMALDGEPDVISTLASQSGLPPTENTFASVLKGKGYSTALIGKWNLGMSCQSLGDLCHHPNNHGFDHFFGMPLVNHYTYASNTPKEELMQKPIIITAVAILMAVVLRKLIGSLAIFIMAVSVLGVFGWTWFCLNNPHIWSNAVMRNGAVVEQPAYMDRMGERMVKEGVRFLRTARADNRPFLLVVSWLNSKDDKTNLEELDQGVNELLKAVHELGLDSNTLTFFTSTPHIPGNNQDDTTQSVSPPMVPAILRWPSVVPSGLVVNAYTSHFDIMPTLVEAAGGALQAGQIYDGRSLFPRLRGELDIPTPLFVYCGAAPHVIMCTSSDGKVYAAHLFPPKWSYDAAAPYCKPQLTTVSARERSDQEETFTIYELTTDTDNINTHILPTNPLHQQLIHTFTTLLEQHRYELGQPVDNQFTWYKQSWHAYLQPKCASTNEFTCTDSDNPLQNTDF